VAKRSTVAMRGARASCAEGGAAQRDVVGLALTLAAAGSLLAAGGMALLYAPREATMGDVQRIFYFHVASAWVGFLAFGVATAAAVAYLARGAPRWDALSLSSVEVGLAFMIAAVLTGSLWARPVWGVFWTWEPRLTISAVQLLLYVAYLMLRGAVDDPSRRGRLAAVYSILAFVSVPLSWFAIRWWRTIHPDLLSDGGMAVSRPMLVTLAVALLAHTLCYVTLLRQRVRLEGLGREVDRLWRVGDSEGER